MKAVVFDGYGGCDRLVLREIESPIPGPGEVLVRVKAAGVNPVDWKLAEGQARPILPKRFPWVPGGDVAGEVEEVGPGLSRFTQGDPVFCMTGGMGGGYAERVVVKEEHLSMKPDSWTFEEAASVPIAGLTALQSLRDLAGVGHGARVTIHGGAGGVGHFAIQIANALGASVTATCGPANLEFVRRLGADRVIDYTRYDFTRRGGMNDAVLDAVGKRGYFASRRVLVPGGTYVSTLPSIKLLFWWAVTRFPRPGRNRKAHFILARPNGDDLMALAAMADSGRLRPHLDLVVPLDRVREAHERSRSGHTRGKIVLRVE